MIAKDLRIGDVWTYNDYLLPIVSKTIIRADVDEVSIHYKDCVRLTLYQPGKGLVHAVINANTDLDDIELAFAIRK